MRDGQTDERSSLCPVADGLLWRSVDTRGKSHLSYSLDGWSQHEAFVLRDSNFHVFCLAKSSRKRRGFCDTLVQRFCRRTVPEVNKSFTNSWRRPRLREILRGIWRNHLPLVPSKQAKSRFHPFPSVSSLANWIGGANPADYGSEGLRFESPRARGFSGNCRHYVALKRLPKTAHVPDSSVGVQKLLLRAACTA